MEKESSYPIKITVNNWNISNKKKRQNKNRVTSTRYTWYSFFPLVFIQQFQIIWIFYFLIILVISGIIDSPYSFGVDTFPLSLLIALSIALKAYEQIKLYISDKEINEQKTLYLKKDTFVTCQSQSLNPGDIIKCQNNCPFPADLLLLFSSRETNDCSVTTVNLDGESSLKTFYGVIDLINEDSISQQMEERRMEINCMKSCEDLDKYQGVLYSNNSLEKNLTLVSESNLLLRGARLKNTDFIVGCVVYAGNDTKLSLNSQIKRSKITSVDSALNLYIFFYLAIQIIISVISCIITNVVYFNITWFNSHWYIPIRKIGAWKQFEYLLAFFVLHNKLIPTSLIFSIYTLKAVASFKFNLDLRMYDEETDQRARVNAIDVMEEMGQIEYLFSDKTGTLTENKMEFQCCSTVDEKYRDINNELYCITKEERKMTEGDFKQNLKELFISLCLCHTVKVSNLDGSPYSNFEDVIEPSEILYQASSPDEEAFLEALKNYKIIYLGAKHNTHYISVFGEILLYELRSVLKFDSTRKCMSVIVDFPDGSSQVICKGAESSLFPLARNTDVINELMENLAEFSQEGLRVLVVAKKELTREEADKFCSDLNHYRSTPSLVDREYEISTLIESNLTVLGVTGVEDKLQDGVPETIRDLKAAGIKIWVITGDKEETAVNISFSAGHFDLDMSIHRLTNIVTKEECFRKLSMLLDLVKVLETSSNALVVDGKCFSFLVDPKLVISFIEICSFMKVTLCCRMTPLQKSQIVQIVKQYIKPTPITAAIGDGGNDVSMILEAHVGIGIFGKEGRQAARISDYAIAKFKFLKPAILFHGQSFYVRLTTFFTLFFYKSVLYINPLFIYSFPGVFSALHIFDTVSASLYNSAFANLPILIYGIFDKPMPDEDFLSNPLLYRRNFRNKRMGFLHISKAFLLGFVQSSIIFTIVYYIYSYSFDFVGQNGKAFDYLVFGLLIFYSSWGLLLAKIALMSKSISIVTLVFFITHVLFILLAQIIYQKTLMTVENNLTNHVLSEPLSWLLIFIAISICLFIDIFDILYKNHRSLAMKEHE